MQEAPRPIRWRTAHTEHRVSLRIRCRRRKQWFHIEPVVSYTTQSCI
jgi:hypothetical protein